MFEITQFTPVSGALFGAGLVISGLSNPVKVLSFPDVTGSWDLVVRWGRPRR